MYGQGLAILAFSELFSTYSYLCRNSANNFYDYVVWWNAVSPLQTLF